MHVDNKGIIDGLHLDIEGIIDGVWRGDRKCIDQKDGDAGLWIKNWEEMHLLMSKKYW